MLYITTAKRLEFKISHLRFKFINHISHGALFRQSNVMNYHLKTIAIRLEERHLRMIDKIRHDSKIVKDFTLTSSLIA